MGKGYLLIFLIFFLNFIFASEVGLIYNSFWSQNLTGSDYFNAAVFGDINNDGYLDLVSIGAKSGVRTMSTITDKSYVYINNGTTFNEDFTWEQNLSEIGYGSLALGDINNDGYLDLVLSGRWPKYITRVYINNGTTFNENLTWENPAILDNAGSTSILLGDIDNDGDLDLLLTGTHGYSNQAVYINNGTSFVNDSFWSREITEEDKASSVLADFDNDNLLDLNVMGYYYAKTYINNGTSFVYNSLWNSVSGDEGSIVFGDINNDGKIDTVQLGSGESCSDKSNVLINNGTQFLTIHDGGNFDIEGAMSCFWFGCLSLGDYDNNGYLDLASMGVLGGIDGREIWENNGSSFIEDENVEANIGAKIYSSIIFGDVDKDNILDFLVMSDPPKIYINNITTPNTAPNPPFSTTFSSFYRDREINLGWGNGSDSETSALGLYYNLMMGDASTNHTIISGVYGGYADQTGGGTTGGYFGNMMQRKNFSLKVDRLQPSTKYYWYIQTIDTGLKAGAWGEIQSFTTPADMEHPAITLNSPENANFSNYYNITFNATVSDNVNLTNVSLWGNWTGSWHLNETNSSLVNGTFYKFTINLSSVGNGYYMWMIEATDNQSNVENSSTRVFTIDTNNPSLNISTANNTNSSNTGLDITYFSSDINRDKCWYGKDNDSTNITLTDCANITTVTWAEGIHNLTIWVNDSAGNINQSYLLFTIDTIYPSLNMSSPTNNTNTTDTSLDVKYFASDTNLDKCWYSNDTYSVNTTLSNCANITAMIWSERVHNLTIWVNDSAGNVNSSYLKFTVDTTNPGLNFSTMNNTNSTDSGLDVRYFASDTNLDKCWYSNDTYSINTTLGSCANITTVTWAEGIHNLTIWVNDSAGNINQSYLLFTIDTIYPSLNMSSPTNNTNTTDTSLDVKYFASDTNLDKCWYSNDTYSVNTTLSNCANITAMIWSERVHNLTIWVNDSAGNVNSSYLKFTVDNSYPIVNLTSPINGESWTSSSTVTFTYNVSDVNIVNCSLIINGIIDQTDTTVTVNTPQTFTKSLSNADYSWSVNCTDVVNYVNNSDSETVTVSYTSSTTPSSGGGGGGGSASYWTNTETITEEQFSNGIEKELSAKQRVQVVINNEAHFVGVIGIDEVSNFVTINVSSTPIQIILGIGDDVKLDVNNDSFYDIYLKVENIILKKVNLTIKEIHEQIIKIGGEETNETEVGNETGGEINGGGNETGTSGKNNWDKEKSWAIGGIIVVGVLIVSIFLFFLIKHLRRKRR